MEFRVLGPVQATDDFGEPIKIDPRCKPLLGVMLTQVNMSLDKNRLAEIWEKTPQKNTVDQAIGELRLWLDGYFGDRARLPKRRGEPLRLEVEDPQVIDYHRFQEHVKAASNAEDEAAVEALAVAVGEIRGTPLEGLSPLYEGSLVKNIRVKLGEECRNACSRYLDRLEALDRLAECLEPATEYTQRWPGDEQLIKYRMKALVAVGRRSDAKAAFAEFDADHKASVALWAWVREAVDQEAVQEPSPGRPVPEEDSAGLAVPREQGDSAALELRNLSALLADDMDIVGTASGEGGQRRLSAGLYVERARHTKQILDLVTGPGQDRIVISGEAGYGKSTLQWGLFRELRKLPGIEPLLVNSAWLISSSAFAPAPERVVSADQVVRAVEAIRSSGDTAVVLLDTADLLLHSNEDRVAAINLCARLEAAEAKIVIACRPREAELLPRDRRKTFDLERYDDTELPVAVANYAQVYCPDAAPRDPAARVERIMNAVARSLPAHDVCRNPLHLRMLFELYDDEFPVSELDVSGLYDKYRRRKIKSDQRIEVGHATGEDLSIAAEQLAVALLVAGRSELSEEEILRGGEKIRAKWPTETPVGLEDALQHLMRRGVLLRAGRVIRFNHQTLFEYIAAWGLITRDGGHAADRLVEHLLSQPTDLFAGAVLEQVLILLARDPAHAPAVRTSLDVLLADRHTSLRGIALMVIARHPQLKELSRDLLEAVEPAAVRRYVQVVPTIVHSRLSELFAQLRAVWDTDDDECRQAVMEALERLSAQAPENVVEFLRSANCADHVINHKRAIFPTHHVLPRTYAAIAPADPAYAGKQLALFYRVAVERAAGRDLCVVLLRLVAECWESIHDAELLRTFRDLVRTGQEGQDRDASAVREAFGRVMAAQWWLDREVSPDLPWRSDEHPWLLNVRRVCEQVELDDEDTIAGAELVAIAFVLARLEPGHSLIGPTLDLLLAVQPPRVPHQLSRGPFPVLLRAGGPASDVLAARIATMLESLPAPANRVRSGPQLWASVARAALNDAALPPDKLAGLLANVAAADPSTLWLSADGLLVFLVPAAIGGHSTAWSVLKTLRTTPAKLGNEPRGLVLGPIRTHLTAAPDLFPLLVALSEEKGEAKHLTEAVKSLGARAFPVLAEHGGSLLPILERLLGGNGGQQRDAMNLWLALEQAGHGDQCTWDQLITLFRSVTDPRAKANMLTLIGRWTSRGAAPLDQTRTLLASFVEVEGEPATLVAGRGGGQDQGVLKAARDAMIQVLAARMDLSRGDIGQVRRLASATPTDGGVFALAGTAASALAGSGRAREAAELVVNLVADATTTGQTDNVVEKLANRLRRPVVLVFRNARLADKRWLLAQAPEVHQTLGRMIVNSAVQESFENLKHDLDEMTTHRLPPGVARQLDNDLRAKARTAGSTQLPQLAEPYAATEPARRDRFRWWRRLPRGRRLSLLGVAGVLVLVAFALTVPWRGGGTPVTSTPQPSPGESLDTPSQAPERKPLHACKLLDPESVALFFGLPLNQLQPGSELGPMSETTPNRERVTNYTNCVWKAVDPGDSRTLVCQYLSFGNNSDAEAAFDAIVKIKKEQYRDFALVMPPNIGDKAVMVDSGAHWMLAEKVGFIVDLSFEPAQARNNGEFRTLATSAASRGLFA